MSIGVSNLESAIKEARRFLKAAKRLKAKGETRPYRVETYAPGKHTAAVKRASMDLTRALPALRRPPSEVDK